MGRRRRLERRRRLAAAAPPPPPPEPTEPAAFGTGDWSITAADEGAQVTITALPNDGGAEITDIEYRLDDGEWASSDGVVSFAITGLTNDQEYAVTVRAINEIGAGPASAAKTVTPAAPASAPAAFGDEDWTLTPADQRATVGIVALPDDGGSAITDIEYKLDDGEWTSAESTESFDIEGLTNAQEYAVALRAVNAVGAGEASAPKLVTPNDD